MSQFKDRRNPYFIAIYDVETGEIEEARQSTNLRAIVSDELAPGMALAYCDFMPEPSRHRINPDTLQPELIPVLEREARDFVALPLRRVDWRANLLLDLESAKTVDDLKSVLHNVIERLR